MTKKQWVIAIVLADFVALNAYALIQYGYMAVIREVVSTVPGILVLVDLTIALAMVGIWMWNDAKRRGVEVVPYLVVGLLFGSVGPLLYLLRTSGTSVPEAAGAPLAVASR
jgi:hypothetical protein